MPESDRPESETSPNEPATSPMSPEMPAPNGGSTAEAAPEPIKQDDPRVAELSSLLVHLKADFDNYRKRAQKEIASAARVGELEAVKKFIPAMSNLERALAAAGTLEGPAQALAEGVKQIHHQLVGILTSLRIERIPGVGTPFDPTLHDAVAATSSPDVPPGTVVDEFEAGWQADGRALVPAKVRVSTAE